jgi:hypothetical protein
LSLKVLKSLKQITLVKLFTVDGREAPLACAGAAPTVADACSHSELVAKLLTYS